MFLQTNATSTLVMLKKCTTTLLNLNLLAS